jgi:hypothetical protein
MDWKFSVEFKEDKEMFLLTTLKKTLWSFSLLANLLLRAFLAMENVRASPRAPSLRTFGA